MEMVVGKSRKSIPNIKKKLTWGIYDIFLCYNNDMLRRKCFPPSTPSSIIVDNNSIAIVIHSSLLL